MISTFRSRLADLAARLAAIARQWVEQRYDWDTIPLIREIRATCPEPSRRIRGKKRRHAIGRRFAALAEETAAQRQTLPPFKD